MRVPQAHLRIFMMCIAITLSTASLLITAHGEPTRSERVVMRDGTRLVTDTYLPKGDGPYPTVIVRTPYPRNQHSHPDLVEAGYAVVVQSTRGRFGSGGGDGLIFADDGWGRNQDGYDCVEWAAKQSWCNGRIGTIGVSAPGITQYLMAGSVPPSLACQVVGLAPCSMYHQSVFQGGALRKEQVEGWTVSNGIDAGNIGMLAKHSAYDDLWRGLDVSTRFDKVNVPVLHIAGWYDTFLQGNLDCFVGFQNSGDKGAKGKQKIIIGPFTHGGKRNGGEIEYPDYDPPGGIPSLKWLDYWLKGEENEINEMPAVTYYTMGAVGEAGAPGNEWRTSDVWPVRARVTPYYLHRGGLLSLQRPTEDEVSMTYRFDPDNPVTTIGGNNLTTPSGPRDQRAVERRDDVLVFTSAPLEKPVEVTGRIKVKLWASTSAKDTDFTAKLTDVYPDGRSMLVCDGIIRARYRQSFERPELLRQGRPYEFEIDLWSTSIVFNKGHQIRVAISSSNTPRFDVNPNTGELPMGAKGKITAENTIYLDSRRPSAIYLPVVETR